MNDNRKVRLYQSKLFQANHITIVVSDVERSLHFYSDIIGMKKIHRPDFDRWQGTGVNQNVVAILREYHSEILEHLFKNIFSDLVLGWRLATLICTWSRAFPASILTMILSLDTLPSRWSQHTCPRSEMNCNIWAGSHTITSQCQFRKRQTFHLTR